MYKHDSCGAQSAVSFDGNEGSKSIVTQDVDGINGNSFDGRGNYAMGLKEHIVFPEIDFDKVDETWGMDIVIATTAKTDAEAKALLKAFNMPFTS